MANYKILLLDYEPRSLERLVGPLERAGYEVHVAKDGLTGIEAFHRLEPALTLIEAMLPKKHGFDVCQELKNTPHGRLTPIVIITSVYKGRKYRTQALHHYGCDEYLEKPIEESKLLETVEQLLVSAVGSATPPETPAADTVTEAVSETVTSDNAEVEIMERLDELMGGTPDAAAEPEPVDSELDGDGKVVSFDPERARKRRDATPTGNVSGGNATVPSAGGAETAMSQEVVPRAGAVPEPQVVNATPQVGTAIVPATGRSFTWIWLLIAVAILAGAAGAVYYFGLI